MSGGTRMLDEAVTRSGEAPLQPLCAQDATSPQHRHRSEVRVGEGPHVGDIDATQRVRIRDSEGNRGRLVPLPQAAI